MQAAKAVQAMGWQAVCDRADLIANSGVVAWLDGDQVAVFYLPEAGEGRVLHAIDNHDPRSGANVLGRGIVGYLQGELVVAAPLQAALLFQRRALPGGAGSEHQGVAGALQW